jgi:predicted DNA-binding transcriptional regulator AlpA
LELLVHNNTYPLASRVREFCDAVGIGKSKFYEEVRAGRIRLRKLGGRSVVAVDDARAYIENAPLAGRSETDPRLS